MCEEETRETVARLLSTFGLKKARVHVASLRIDKVRDLCALLDESQYAHQIPQFTQPIIPISWVLRNWKSCIDSSAIVGVFDNVSGKTEEQLFDLIRLNVAIYKRSGFRIPAETVFIIGSCYKELFVRHATHHSVRISWPDWIQMNLPIYNTHNIHMLFTRVHDQLSEYTNIRKLQIDVQELIVDVCRISAHFRGNPAEEEFWRTGTDPLEDIIKDLFSESTKTKPTKTQSTKKRKKVTKKKTVKKKTVKRRRR